MNPSPAEGWICASECWGLQTTPLASAEQHVGIEGLPTASLHRLRTCLTPHCLWLAREWTIGRSLERSCRSSLLTLLPLTGEKCLGIWGSHLLPEGGVIALALAITWRDFERSLVMGKPYGYRLFTRWAGESLQDSIQSVIQSHFLCMCHKLLKIPWSSCVTESCVTDKKVLLPKHSMCFWFVFANSRTTQKFIFQEFEMFKR